MSQRCERAYKKHLEDWFKYISYNSDIQEKCDLVAGLARNVYSKLKACADDNWSINIEPQWQIPISNDDNFRRSACYLLVGGKIEVKDYIIKFYTFTLSVVTNRRIVRRFHFDIDTGGNAQRKSVMKPKCHIQYGGEAYELRFNPTLKYTLASWIEKPRFPFPPIDIVLLLDFTLSQINTSLGHKFVDEHYWKKLVRESEKLRLKEYYDQIHQHLGNFSSEKRTLFEKLCG